MEDGGTSLTCLQPSCGLSMQPSEVKHHLQEIRANLERAVDLMERERPGHLINTQDIMHLFVCCLFVFFRTGGFQCPNSLWFSSAPPRRSTETAEKDPAPPCTDAGRDAATAWGARGCYSQSVCCNG